ncbi:MAG TPA: lipoprotein-releasing system ATP-binding protein LolD, partial [Pseudoalteromonas sp.]|nr:lipoprotein-releasing system ATP-binding protein LolD [Pseudoalteromonas sp.]
TSFVVVTHDLELADKLGKIAYLDDGKLAIKESQYVA